EHNIDRYSRTPVFGIVVLGSTGEAVMLSDEERHEVLRESAAACSAEKVLVAGTGCESAIETLKLTEFAAACGYDVALVRTPHFYRPQLTQGEAGAKAQLAFYRFVADRSPIPVALYSVPPFTAYDLPVEVVAELADHPNIVGLKESSGKVDRVAELIARTRNAKKTFTVTTKFEAATSRMLRPAAEQSPDALVQIGNGEGSLATATPTTIRTRTKEVSFQILVGAAHTLHDSLQVGASGAVLAFADPAPTACFEVYAAWKDNDQALAALKQERITEPSRQMAAKFGVPGVKYAMDLNGYYGGDCRLPLLPLTGEDKNAIEKLMQEIRN
ncbi:MAG TPA: dihydrodipicolinate synthase family protein, partial [Terriglobales bacterium]